VDARVRVTGLAAGYINHRRQLLSPQLLVNQLGDVHLETPPPTDPFLAPLTDASALLNFDPAGTSEHRVRVRGVVTHRHPGEALFLRDGKAGLLIETAQTDLVKPGDLVEAAGFPAMGRFSAFLDDAVFRVTGRGPDPQPVPITLTEALTGTNDANLITLDAQLLEVVENPSVTLLVLRAEDNAFRARMPRAALPLRKGSTVRLTGVCRVEEFSPVGTGFGASPRAIEMLLRSPADVVVLTAPSAWTAQRLAGAAGILLGVTLLSFGWVALLRRRVTEQARVIRVKVQREAALEERHRMAREMHDTLAQRFSGLGFQLEALNARLPENADAARNQLETAQQMVRHGQEGFRRSLLNLRAQELEHGSLTDALTELARHVTAGSGIELHCDVQRSDLPLPEAVEANLLRIGQECLANAVRHGNPQRVELSFRHEAGRVQLRIADDGAGFDPAQLPHAGNGHFGWRGIRERAAQIGALVELKSQPGLGTSVTVVVLTEK
jgi:signal transduction histidine kinase